MQLYVLVLLCTKVVIKMSEWICIGKIVNTHGIKGELRILSDFDKKEKVFQPQFTIYIGIEKEKKLYLLTVHIKNLI